MEWPILERLDLIEAAQQHLATRPFGSVILQGGAGVGKTTVARQLVERHEQVGATTLWLASMAELVDAPLAVFGPHLAQLGLASHEVTARSVVAAVGRLVPTPLLVVDDAPLLDPASAAVVYQLVRVYGVPATLTARTSHRESNLIERMLAEQIATPLAVPGLDLEEVRALVRRRYAAAPRPDDVSRLWSQSGGNALLLRQVVTRTEQWECVRRVPAGVELDPVEVPTDAAASVTDLIARLEESQRGTVARVGLGVGLPASELLDLDRLRQLGVLVEIGLLDQTGRDQFALAHPLVGEAALALLDPEQKAAVVREVATRLLASGDPGWRMRAVLLLCDTGVLADRLDMAWAIGHAYSQGEYLVAVRLHELTRHAAGPSVDARAAIQHASALSWLDRLEEAEVAFNDARGQCRTANEWALLVSCWGTHLAYRRFDVAAAVELAQQCRPHLGTAEQALLGPELRTWMTLLGVDSSDELAAAARPRSEANDPAVAVRAAVAGIMLEAMAGRTDGEAAGVLAALETAHGVLEPHAAAMLHLQEYFALLSTGRGAQAQALAEEQRVGASASAAGIWTYTLAVHLTYAGRLTQAGELVELAQEQLRWRDPLGLLGAARVLAALVVVQLGDAVRARRLLDQVPAEQRNDPKAAMLVAEAEALLLVADGEPDAAAVVVEAAAKQAAANGFGLVAAISLSVCLRIGRPHHAVALLTEIADGVDPNLGLYQALRLTSRGLADDDPEAVLEGAKALANGGMVAAAVDALRWAEATTPPRGAGELLRRIVLARQEWQRDNEAVVLVRGARSEVSGREWDVAVLACARLSSREIAEQLDISVRTVDNHLRNVYRKLAVTGRAELRELLGEA